MMITSKQFNQLIKGATQRRWLQSSKSGEAGFTIIESLMAIVVVSILMAAIAPVLALSVATRVQARRIELASQAARAYIDGVRARSILPPDYAIMLNEVSSNAFVSARDTFADTNAPDYSLSCASPTNGYCANTTNSSLYCIDRDGGGCANTSSQDLVVQAFRSTTTGGTTDQGYLLAVRVYRADAFDGSSTLKTMKDNNAKASTFTGGLGDRLAPLVEITSEITSEKTKFQDYCTRFGGCTQ